MQQDHGRSLAGVGKMQLHDVGHFFSLNWDWNSELRQIVLMIALAERLESCLALLQQTAFAVIGLGKSGRVGRVFTRPTLRRRAGAGGPRKDSIHPTF